MKRWRPVCLFSLLFAIGCGQVRPAAPPTIVGQRTLTVSGDTPFIEMGDGTRIGVDGVPPGQSRQFEVTQYRDSNGKMTAGVDTPSESIP
jgi:hypothetical protein